ncbi:hypothetical protein CK203_038681 [Vitis vinifera]|uniref:Uncharacterized protein n=1 Tax=Vitis vinifera TaxID=29760 RepID=A0A438HV33_VITVI|nr:hypothetical protein CK203_038681 [Vitis vinifera]
MPKTRGGYASAPQSSQRVAPIPPRSPPTKKAKTSEPGQSSRAPRDSQSPPPPTRCPIASSPIEGNSDCRSRAFHVEAYFDHSILRQQLELRDSYRLLERYHLVPFMTPPQFFYPQVALDFYQSMTTRGVPIAEAFHIPYAPADPLHLDAGPHFLSGTCFLSPKQSKIEESSLESMAKQWKAQKHEEPKL